MANDTSDPGERPQTGQGGQAAPGEEREAGRLEEHLTTPAIWLRLLYMVLFAVIFYINGVVLLALVVLQWLIVLVTGESNARLLRLGGLLSAYAMQILLYLTFNENEPPFPFDDLPGGDA